MGIFNKIRKAFRKGEPLPHEHGPAIKFTETSTGKTVHIKVVKATTDDKPTTIPSEYAKTVVAKQKAASKTKPSTDSENKKKPVAKKPVPKATAKKEAIKKDIADTPVAKKPAPKKTSAKPAVKKSTPKKK